MHKGGMERRGEEGGIEEREVMERQRGGGREEERENC